jgi:beta-lactam-binding protein with PASTA domain
MLAWTVLLGTACIALVGCGTETVSVPNVIGEQAGTAVRSIEDANLTANLNPEPEDRSLCTVDDQSETGEVEEGTEVTLRLTCRLDIPDVTQQTTGEAKAR